MTPRIHCIRHAQGFHNLNVANHAMHDPLLTPLGQEQCKTLARNFPYIAEVDCVVASPLKRTVYTALLSMQRPIESKKLKVIALPELQETSDLPCDTGSEVAEIEREFQNKPVDWAILETPEGHSWNSKSGKWAPHADAINKRAKEARQWLRKRPEKDIVVVTHGGFLHYFTEDWGDSDRFQGTHKHRCGSEEFKLHHHLSEIDLILNKRHAGTGWANTEYRSYTFDANSDSLHETPDSLQRRAGTEKPLSKEEQKNLHRTTTQKWQEQGYQKAKDIQAKV